MPVSGKTIKTENWKSKRRQWFEMKRNYLSLNSAYEIHMMCVYAIRVYPTIKSLNKKKNHSHSLCNKTIPLPFVCKI